MGAEIIFLGCLRIRIRNLYAARAISVLASATFGVYLIHMQPFVRDVIWFPTMKSISSSGTLKFMGKTFVVALSVFFLSSVLDLLRDRIFDWIKIKRLLALVDSI